MDIRYASKDAVLSIREIEIGMAADIGSLQFLPKIVGNFGWIKEAAMTGRDFSPDEAQEQGLINKVFPTKEEAVKGAIDLATMLAKKSPVAMHGLKKSLNYAIDHTVPEGLEQIAQFNSHGLGEDFMIGAMNARNKVKPRYEKL